MRRQSWPDTGQVQTDLVLYMLPGIVPDAGCQ